MAENNVVHTLNEFLRGQYMGIHQYEQHIERLTDPRIKKVFQAIQQDHKHHAQIIAERIQNLGGTPVDDEGVIGSVQGYFSQFKIPDTTEGAIENALKGEDTYGIGMSEKIVRGDLDDESYGIVEDILNKDREHVEQLNGLLH